MSIWKAIGCSVTGLAHEAVGKGCEDALEYRVVRVASGEDILVCCTSDGAGSATYAAYASAFCTARSVEMISGAILQGREADEALVREVIENLYDSLENEAQEKGVELNEYSCTLLGCIIRDARAVFFQVGDGAIVRGDEAGSFVPVWMPHNGEYQNMTSFVIDDVNLVSLHICVLEEPVNEVAMFTDGLQMLALNMEASSVHQPFFTPLFRYLRMADDDTKVQVLQRKLEEYLNSALINDRTDDDKTLFLATRQIQQ